MPSSTKSPHATGQRGDGAGNSPVALLEKLIAFDTTSRNSNMELIDFTRDYLAAFDVVSELVPNCDGSKANLFATIGPQGVGGIGLSGHTDVVPVDGQNWTTDPFKLSERDGLLYGRGSADMKGFLACVLSLVPEMTSRRLSTPFHILFSYDEEVGCTGVRPMIDEFAKRLVMPRLVIVGEPTMMSVVDGHKGAARFDTKVTGHEAHSSMAHLGVNAIQYAARFIAELRNVEAELKAQITSPRYTPEYSTVHVGLISGGTAMNIVPKACSFAWEIRMLAGIDLDEVVARMENFVERECHREMHAISPGTGFETTISNLMPAFSARDNSEAVSLALKLAGQNETFAVSYGTEAGLFERAGPAAVICGPGDIAQAHAPDEFIAVAQLDACVNFLRKLIDRETV